MSNRALTTLAYAAVVVFCTAAAVYFGMLRERADIAVELARLDQQLTSEFTQSVRFAALLPDHRQVREAALLGDPGQTESDALNKLAIKTGRLAIIVSGPDGQILATGLRNPDSAPPIEKLPVALAQSLSSNQLSRRFVFTESDGWLFEAGKAISGLKQERLGQVHAYQPLEDFAQIWNALPDTLRLKTTDGRVLFENRQFVGANWRALRATSRSLVHGTELELERSARVLVPYGAVGFLLGLAVSLGLLAARVSASRRDALTQARIDALGESAALLEAQVAERTKELRDSQSELVQTAKLGVLDDMTIGLSHELSQPLFALEASLDTLACQLGEQAEARKTLEKTQRVAERMGQILNNLKSFARKDDERPVVLDLAEPVTAALEMLEHKAADHHVTITHKLRGNPLLARATATRLQQVVVNVVSNSLDAIAKDGTGLVHIEHLDGPSLRISDNGPGFADETSALAPFATTKADQNSLGLGLAISDRIMKSFGGSLTLGDGPLGGASVTLNFEAGEQG